MIKTFKYEKRFESSANGLGFVIPLLFCIKCVFQYLEVFSVNTPSGEFIHSENGFITSDFGYSMTALIYCAWQVSSRRSRKHCLMSRLSPNHEAISLGYLVLVVRYEGQQVVNNLLQRLTYVPGHCYGEV